VIALAACSSNSGGSAEEQRSDATENRTPADAVTPKKLSRDFDAQGRLVASEDYVVGIRLPRGSELVREQNLEHVYRVRAPIDKVLAYIGPMMITGNVERRGKGAIYKRASVRGAEVNPTKVDVSVLEIGERATRISVIELPPPPAHIPSLAETKAAASESFRQLD
jgi:hypothetical protein